MGKRSLVLWLTAIFVLFGGVLTSLAEEKVLPVRVEVSAAFGNMGKIGSHVPLQAKLYGQSESPFTGTLRVSTLENGNDGKEEGYEYSWEVTVRPAETKTLELYVPLGQKSNEIHVSLRDGSGREISTTSMTFDISRDMGRLLVGALSEDAFSLGYLDQVSLDYGMVRSTLLPMTEKELPADARGLEMLDILLVNRYDSSLLSEEQRAAVLSWVRDGGILLFGTGLDGIHTTDGFLEEIPESSLGEVSLERVDMGAEYAKETPGDSELLLYCRDVVLPGGEARMESDELPIFTTAKLGQGVVGFFAYDLGDISGFVQENPSYGVRLLTSVLGEEQIYNLSFYSAYGRDAEYWNAQNLVTRGNADRLPNLFLYGAVILGYIVLVGPGIHLMLKKRELGRYYGMAVLLFSIVSCGVIYIMGIGTRFSREFSTYASVLDLGTDQLEELTYLNIRTPDSRGFSLKVSPEYVVEPLTRSSRYDESPLVEFDGKRAANMGLRAEGDGTVLWSGRSRAFDSRLFRLSRRTENPLGEKITADVEVFDGTVTGYVSNGFSFPLENAALFLYGQVLPLGTLKPGEYREFDKEPLLTWPVGMSYVLAERLADSTGADGETESEHLKEVEKSGLYSFFLDHYYGSYNSEVRLGAFGPAEQAGGGGFGGQSDGCTIYTAVLDSTSGRDGLVYRSGQIRQPEITSGTGSVYGSSMVMYGTEPMAAEYFLGTDIEVEKLAFLPVSEELLNTQTSYLRQFSGHAYFYNCNTRIYDAVELDKGTFSKEELSDYLSPEGSLLVKYENGETAPAGLGQAIPLLMVTGRKR